METFKFGNLKILIILILTITSVNCGILRTRKEVKMDVTTFSFDKDSAPFEVFAEYHIVPGDVLDVLYQIHTWTTQSSFVLAVDHTIKVNFIHVPELNRKQKVRPDGTITLPYIGAVNVIGKKVEQLAEELKKRYKDILNIPEIEVKVPDFRSSIKELKQDLHTAPRGLSRLVYVRPDGYVTFPMVGNYQVAGKTIPEVNDDLDKLYEKILPGLHCDLFLEKHAGSLIYLVGHVAKPGGYKIDKPKTLFEAFSLAGGLLSGANRRSIFVMRRHKDKMIAKRVDFKKLLSFK